MTDQSIRRFFSEAKRLADDSARGDVAELIDRGITALQREGMDSREHADAAQRAGHWDAQFKSEDWALAKECEARMRDNPAAARVIVHESEQRVEEMNRDIFLVQSLYGGDDELTASDPVDALWVHRMLGHIRLACEQTLRNYLGMFVAAGDDDPAGVYKKTQRYDIGDFCHDPGVPESLKPLLHKARVLRNAGAHADFFIRDGQVWIRPDRDKDHKPWAPEKIADTYKSLLRSLGAISLGTTTGSGPYRSERALDVSAAAADGSDLSLIEHLLSSWMEWEEVRASLADGVITVDAKAPGPVRFGSLLMAAGQCNLCEAASKLACRVTFAGPTAGWPPMTVEFPVRPRPENRPPDDPAEDEQRAIEHGLAIKIDGKSFFDGDDYGGMPALYQDDRFAETEPVAYGTNQRLSGLWTAHYP